MRYTTLALAGLVASAAALALLAGFATTRSPLNSFYAVGGAEAPNEPVKITDSLIHSVSPAAGAQGSQDMGYIIVWREPNDVNIVKLGVTLANAEQLKNYFDYFTVMIDHCRHNSTKGMVSLDKPSTVVVLDTDDFDADGNRTSYLCFTAYYEAKEGMLFDSVPVAFNFQVLSTS
ncbi:hypothetical protein CF15_01655 [Pyrodictium occultum]|uniref:Uncharacterized protein n=1 Tax=Pyrodictium occultum TaxID=2309 RepID=A0A0V8RU29_PYROC|nr:hypothetical protein [Pyrodictium occultum]KSW11568.1 hypothetical protein CF15_01655 [Pyrodictium occultum]